MSTYFKLIIVATVKHAINPIHRVITKPIRTHINKLITNMFTIHKPFS